MNRAQETLLIPEQPRIESRRRWIRWAMIAFMLMAGAVYGIAYRFWNQAIADLRRPVAPAPARPDPTRWPDRGVHAGWLGHATVLLKVNGVTILTDPMFSTRAGIKVGPITLGMKRLVAPALRVDELPPIDIVLLSHAHMDHFDLPSLRALESRRITVVTAGATADLLRTDHWAAVRELPWGTKVEAAGASITAFEVNHWGTRLRSDRHRRYNGYVIESGGRRVIFVGDTGPTDALARLGGGFDLAILPIGCYNPWWPRHAKPEEAWRMAQDAGARSLLPIHHETFVLSREPVHEPLARLLEAAGGDAGRIAGRRIGEELHID
ncbi:MAG TPA: MBL fold metallo-hydrolase [Bryobacteraceae bacterium]|nr:MBL fold metallo-hydrolase [Bryobacteraceae bacterium]